MSNESNAQPAEAEWHNQPRQEQLVGTLRGKQARTHRNGMGEPDGEPGNQQGSQVARDAGFSGGANVQEFQAFYQEHIGLLYRYVFSKVGNREEAEDLTSQIFLKAVRGMDTERGALSMQKWLFQVARTTIADFWRTYYRTATSSLDELLDAGWEGPAMIEQAAAHGASGQSGQGGQPGEQVRRILQALPEHHREVLTCRFLLNLSIRETADRMGLTEANVKVLQFRALKRAADLENFVAGSL
jgi:RNA polymerase sigma-70 factor, ECF subfamily